MEKSGEYLFTITDIAGNEKNETIYAEPIEQISSSSNIQDDNLPHIESAEPSKSEFNLRAIIMISALTVIAIIILLLLFYYYSATVIIYDANERKLGTAHIKKDRLCLDKIANISDTIITMKIKKSYVRFHLTKNVNVSYNQRLKCVIRLGAEAETICKSVLIN
ncbi:MAG: hypothetical protein RR508_07080 [Oscillospiraceae bacterium]